MPMLTSGPSDPLSIRRAIDDHVEVTRALGALAPLVEEAAERMIECLRSGGKICWMGNGGSAADSQHLAAELVGRFTRERRGLPSIALSTDTSILTAVGDDYGFHAVFARQVEALCKPGDVVVGITTSGRSLNILEAMRRARDVGAYRVGMTGRDGGDLRHESDLLLRVPSVVTARVQEAHLFLGHLLCDLVEAACFDE